MSALCGSKIIFTMGHGPQRVCHLDGQGHILREESRVCIHSTTSNRLVIKVKSLSMRSREQWMPKASKCS